MAEYPKMNPKVKRAWVKALRSGKFKQGADHLISGRGRQTEYCCLGVLCHVECGAVPRDLCYLPVDVAVAAGIAVQHTTGTVQGQLADKMNDRGVPFKTIATWIEKHL